MTDERRWIQLPESLLRSPAEPYVVEAGAVDRLVSHVEADGGQVIVVDVGTATSSADVVDALERVLPFPEWCASGWDPVEDAFQELVEAWSFPLVLMLQGLDRLVDGRPHLVLETAVRLAELSRAFATVGTQLVVVHVWSPTWPDFFASFRLSVQRALWGVIPASLLAVALGVRDGVGTARFVFDDGPGEDENELVGEVETEVVSDFPESAQFSFAAVGGAQDRLGFEPHERWWAYVRLSAPSEDAPTVRATSSGNG